MKILHTSDWHIGQYFYGYDRTYEHNCFFLWLKKTIKERQVDVMLVAGDVFDNPNPSADAQTLYYNFLKEVTSENPELQIVITAGNHDSAGRLEAPNPLLVAMNIHVRGNIPKDYKGELEYEDLFIPLKKNGEILAWCIAVPYLRQGNYPNSESYTKGVKELYDILHKEIQKVKGPDTPIIFMGHLQATGSEVSQNDRSERTIIGGLDCIPPEIFDKNDIAYTALGHLHKAQRVSNRENVRYAGSPLPMSFAEKNYKQGVNLIELKNGGLESITRIDFEPPVRLLSVPQEPEPLEYVLEKIEELPDGPTTVNSPYLELKILLDQPEPSMRDHIQTALEGKAVRLASAVPYRKGVRVNPTTTITFKELKELDACEIADDYFRKKYGGETMPKTLKELLNSVIREVKT